MTRKTFLLSLIQVVPVLALGQLKDKSSKNANESVVLIRKFYAKDSTRFDHDLFNKTIASSFDMQSIQKDHQSMLDKRFITHFERQNFEDHVVFKITFNSQNDLESYKNKISKFIVDKSSLVSQFKNFDKIVRA